jgi:hypothetical protein
MEPNIDERINARFERIENVLEALAHSQKQLLTAQVVMTDEVTRIASAEVRLTEAQQRLAEAQALSERARARLEEEQAKTEIKAQETQGKLDALIHMWDEWIRERREREGGESIQ